MSQSQSGWLLPGTMCMGVCAGMAIAYKLGQQKPQPSMQQMMMPPPPMPTQMPLPPAPVPVNVIHENKSAGSVLAAVDSQLTSILNDLSKNDTTSTEHKRTRVVNRNNRLDICADKASIGEPIKTTISTLKQGFRQFKESVFSQNHDYFMPLAAHQSPKVMVIACCDSRCDPDTLMGAAPGEIFTVRSIANLIPPYSKKDGALAGTSAALEYAVTALKVEHVVVMGHQFCGGIKALMSRSKGQPPNNEFVDDWMCISVDAAERVKGVFGHLPFDDQCRCCERESVNNSLKNLMTYPFVKKAVEGGQLGIHGWLYNMIEPSMTMWKHE